MRGGEECDEGVEVWGWGGVERGCWGGGGGGGGTELGEGVWGFCVKMEKTGGGGGGGGEGLLTILFPKYKKMYILYHHIMIFIFSSYLVFLYVSVFFPA